MCSLVQSFCDLFSDPVVCAYIFLYDTRYRWFEFNDDSVTPFDTAQAAQSRENESSQTEEVEDSVSESSENETDQITVAEQKPVADEKPKTMRPGPQGKAAARSGKAKGRAKGPRKGKTGPVGKTSKQGGDSEEESEKEDLHEQGKKNTANDSDALADHEDEASEKEVVASDGQNGPQRWRSDKAYMLLYKRKDLEFEYPTDLQKFIDARDAAQRADAKRILWDVYFLVGFMRIFTKTL